MRLSRGARHSVEFRGRQGHLKDQSAAARAFEQDADSGEGNLHQRRAVDRAGAFELDAIDPESGPVGDNRIPPDRIEASGYTTSAPPCAGIVQKLLIDPHVAVFVGEM